VAFFEQFISFLKTSPLTQSTQQTLITKGDEPGHLGLAMTWDSAHHPNEIYRIQISVESADIAGPNPISFTFAPGFDASFFQSLELPMAYRNFLRGTVRAKQAEFVFQIISLSGTSTLKLSLADVLNLYRGKSANAPARAIRRRRFQAVDDAKLASMSTESLKAYSDKIRADLEEARRKEEELAKKKADEAAAAAAKAAQAKAAAATAKTASSGAAVDRTKPTMEGGKVAIFYGSSTGNTADVANTIKAELGDVAQHVRNVSDITPPDLAVCEVIILGVPTWHIGEMQDDWAAVLPEVDLVDLKGKKMAIFGLGDGKGYPDTYVDAIGELAEKFEKRGATLYGFWPTTGYEFKKSKAIRDGKFMGLVIDVENQHNLTEQRIKAWVKQIKSELSL